MIDQNCLAQFNYARANGWIAYFVKSGTDYDWDPALIMAIASRETNMRNIIGDGGHGYSLMQIDIRSAPDWVSSGAWHNVAASVEKGVQMLESKRTQFGHGQGQHLNIGGYAFAGKPFSDQASINHVSVAGYNAGLWAYYAYSHDQDPDRYTTGHNYSADVLKRAESFKQLLEVSP